jgi:hypothetical protein
MKEANPGPDGRRRKARAKKNKSNKAWVTRIKKLSADLPEKVASTSGSGEISTYKMPNNTTSEITHFSQADIEGHIIRFPLLLKDFIKAETDRYGRPSRQLPRAEGASLVVSGA